jgi:hypothetical protein
VTGVLDGFRDPELARTLVDAIRETATVPAQLMEVCGTHTMAIAKHGLRGLMPETITLLSGPGCPVCVTANADIDLAIEMARQPNVILATFGDMMKVPGSYSSLAREKADGRDVRASIPRSTRSPSPRPSRNAPSSSSASGSRPPRRRSRSPCAKRLAAAWPTGARSRCTRPCPRPCARS